MTDSLDVGPSVPKSVLKSLIDSAIKAVPAVRYALGVVGIAAAAALCYSLFKSPAGKEPSRRGWLDTSFYCCLPVEGSVRPDTQADRQRRLCTFEETNAEERC